MSPLKKITKLNIWISFRRTLGLFVFFYETIHLTTYVAVDYRFDWYQILNDVFTPTLEEVTRAKKIVDTFNKSSTGLVVYEGKLIEKPVLRDMLRTINIYDKINSN